MYFPSNKIRPSTQSFLLLFFLAIVSCNNISSSSNSSNPSVKKYDFSLQPDSGYYYIVHNKADIDLEVNNQKINNTNDITVGLIYHVNKDSTGNFVFKVTYDSFDVAMKKNGQTTELNASNGMYSVNPIEKMLAILKGSSLFITINKQGKITSVNGYEEIAENLINEMQITNPVERQQLQLQLASIAGEGFIKNNLEQSFSFFPNSPLHVGESWQKNISATSELGLNVPLVYKLTSVDNNKAIIKSECDINTEDEEINIMGNKARASLKGFENGEIKLDIQTGMVNLADSKISIKGNINIMGSIVPLKIKIQKTIIKRKVS